MRYRKQLWASGPSPASLGLSIPYGPGPSPERLLLLVRMSCSRSCSLSARFRSKCSCRLRSLSFEGIGGKMGSEAQCAYRWGAIGQEGAVVDGTLPLRTAALPFFSRMRCPSTVSFTSYDRESMGSRCQNGYMYCTPSLPRYCRLRPGMCLGTMEEPVTCFRLLMVFRWQSCSTWACWS